MITASDARNERNEPPRNEGANDMPREKTNELLELVDDGVLDARTVLVAALCWMSESDVAEMARDNEFLMAEEEDDEQD